MYQPLTDKDEITIGAFLRIVTQPWIVMRVTEADMTTGNFKLEADLNTIKAQAMVEIWKEDDNGYTPSKAGA